MEHQEWIDALSALRALARERRFDDALALVEDLLAQGPSSTELLVWRARLLQLAPQANARDPLSLAEASLAQACALAPEAALPRIEMGHFSYAVQDRPADALCQFEAAERLARGNWKDALIGKIQCLVALGQEAAARGELAGAAQLFPGDTDLGVLRAELDDDEA